MAVERSYSTQEVAELFGCHEETILRYAQRGELRSWRLGRERRYLESDVHAFLEQRLEEPARVVRLGQTRRSSTSRRTG